VVVAATTTEIKTTSPTPSPNRHSNSGKHLQLVLRPKVVLALLQLVREVTHSQAQAGVKRNPRSCKPRKSLGSQVQL
jgi:hypothetical protein